MVNRWCICCACDANDRETEIAAKDSKKEETTAMSTRLKKSKHPIDMSLDELRSEARELMNINLSDLRPLSPEMRAKWESAKRGRGRPRKLVKAARVLTTIDPQLLAKADAVAKKRNSTRAALIAEGLRMVIAKAG